MRIKPGTAVLGAAVLLSTHAASAHHSFVAEFDGDKPVTLTGPVTKVEWRNPHIWVYLDARDPSGKLTPWQCEGGAPNALTRQGWSRTSLKEGSEIVVTGWRAKDGTNTCNAGTWKLPNGQPVLAGSSNPTAGGNR